jgi:DNA topoisomerase VI subunit B
MNLLEKAQNKILITRYTVRYATARNSKIELELEALKDKYGMTTEDYIKLTVGLQVMAIKQLKNPDGNMEAEMLEYSQIEGKVPSEALQHDDKVV